MKTGSGSGGITSRILDLGTRWRWMVSFTPRPLYRQGESPLYPLDRSLDEPQSSSGCGGEEKNSQPRRESSPRTPIVQSVAQRYTDWVIIVPKQTVLYINFNFYNLLPVPVVAWPKALMAFGCSNTGIVGSSPARDMDVHGMATNFPELFYRATNREPCDFVVVKTCLHISTCTSYDFNALMSVVWLLHHGNAPAHMALSVKQFLGQKSITEMKHQPPTPLTWRRMTCGCFQK
jgi:hypothetical protein